LEKREVSFPCKESNRNSTADPSITTPTHELCCTFEVTLIHNGAGQFKVLFPVWARCFLYCIPRQTNPVGPFSLLHRDVVLTTPSHPHLMLRLRMRTAICLLPLCAFYGMLLGDLYIYLLLYEQSYVMCSQKHTTGSHPGLDKPGANPHTLFSKTHLCAGHHMCKSHTASCSAVSFSFSFLFFSFFFTQIALVSRNQQRVVGHTHLKVPASLSCTLVMYRTPESNVKYLRTKHKLNLQCTKNLLPCYTPETQL
jgi:hypothetical protein